MWDGEIFVREMRRKDISAVLEIQHACGLKGWTQGDYLLELDREDSLTLLVCQKVKADRRTISSEDGAERIFGFAHLRLIMSKNPVSNIKQVRTNTKQTACTTKKKTNSYQTAEIYNYAIHPDHQGKGVGQHLFDYILERLKKHKTEEIWLEVRVSNIRAIGFYRKNGFLKTGTRKNYYTNPTEDALILRRDKRIPDGVEKNKPL